MEVVQIEGSAQMIGTVHLIVQLPEPDVLIGKTGKSAQLRTKEIIGRGALGCRHSVGATQGEGRKTGVADRIHLARTIVGEEVEQFVLDDRPAYAASKLLLL